LTYLSLLLAMFVETVLPDDAFRRLRAWVDHFNQEMEINLDALGAPGGTPYQWLAPVLIWLFGVYWLHYLLWIFSPLLAGLLSVAVLLYGLRYQHFNKVFTEAQLFLNQGDFFRARELVLSWIKDYDGSEVHIHKPSELVFYAISYGAERALRQYFALLFWFLLVPGPSGLVVYLMVHWSVMREHDHWQTQGFAEDRPSMHDLWRTSPLKALFTPRFVLYALEWLPARLLAFTIGLLAQLDDAALAWRNAKSHSRFSNRAPLTSVFMVAVGLIQSVADTQVQALQLFRQLVLKCALVWLIVAGVLAVSGFLP
jgi:adenosylcobinamide-phosphate synthase